MNKEIMDILDTVLVKIADEGDKSAKIMLLDKEFTDIMHSIIDKYCLKIGENENKKEYIINFYEQIIQLSKELTKKIEEIL